MHQHLYHIQSLGILLVLIVPLNVKANFHFKIFSPLFLKKEKRLAGLVNYRLSARSLKIKLLQAEMISSAPRYRYSYNLKYISESQSSTNAMFFIFFLFPYYFVSQILLHLCTFFLLHLCTFFKHLFHLRDILPKKHARKYSTGAW